MPTDQTYLHTLFYRPAIRYIYIFPNRKKKENNKKKNEAVIDKKLNHSRRSFMVFNKFLFNKYPAQSSSNAQSIAHENCFGQNKVLYRHRRSLNGLHQKTITAHVRNRFCIFFCCFAFALALASICSIYFHLGYIYIFRSFFFFLLLLMFCPSAHFFAF